MARLRIALVAGACLLSVSARAAGGISGDEWLASCTGRGSGHTLCVAYARGLADAFLLWRIMDPVSVPACIPEEVDGLQLVLAGQRFMAKTKKQHYDGDALSLLLLAFSQAWPCKR